MRGCAGLVAGGLQFANASATWDFVLDGGGESNKDNVVWCVRSYRQPLLVAAGLMIAVTLASGYMLFSRARPKSTPCKNNFKPARLSVSKSCSIISRGFSSLSSIVQTVVLPASPIIIVAALFIIYNKLSQDDDMGHLMFKALCTPLLGMARWHKVCVDIF